MRTSNPLLRADTFDLQAAEGSATMTIMGTVHKTALLVLAVFGTAIWAWNKLAAEGGAAVYPWLIGSLIGSLVLALVTHWKKHLAYLTAPAYALCEGVILGAISALFETALPGHRHAGDRHHRDDAAGVAVRLPLGPDPRDRELQARRHGGDRRHLRCSTWRAGSCACSVSRCRSCTTTG